MASPARSTRRKPGIYLTLLALFTCLTCACAFGGEDASLRAPWLLCSRAEARASTQPEASLCDDSSSDRAAPAEPTSYREQQAAPLPYELVALEAEDGEVDAAHDPAAARIHVQAAKLAGSARQALPLAPVLRIAESLAASALPRGPPDLRA